MATLREIIKSQAINTLGYSEAQNKESFLVGVDVAFSKTEEHYEKIITRLTSDVNAYKSLYEEYSNDLKTLASIIKRHTESE